MDRKGMQLTSFCGRHPVFQRVQECLPNKTSAWFPLPTLLTSSSSSSVLLVHLLFLHCQSSTSRSETGYDFVHQDSLVMVRKISLAHDSALDPLKLSQSPLTDTPNLNDLC